MIAKYYGANISLKYLHTISDLNRLGMSIKDIKCCCSQIGFDSAAVQVGMEYIEKMPLPAILYLSLIHI